MPIIILRAGARLTACSLRQSIGAAAVVLMLAGCSRAPLAAPDGMAPASEILVEPPRLLLKAGDEAQLSAQANDVNGSPVGGAEFAFASADPKLIRVSQRGLVTSLGPAATKTEVIVSSGPAETRVAVVIVPGDAARLEVVGDERRRIRAGDPDGAPLTMRVVDEWGNSVPAAALTVASHSPQIADGEINSDSGGVARFSLPRLTQVGSSTLTFHVKDVPALAAVFEVTVSPGPPASIALVSRAQDAATSVAAAPAQAAAVMTEAGFRVADSFDNPVPDATLVVSSASGLAPVTLRTDTSGLARFAIPQDRRSRRQTLIATIPDVPGLERRFLVDLPRTASR